MPKDQLPYRFIRDSNYHGQVNKLPRNDKRIPGLLKQRKKRGFDDTETWNLDHTILEFTLPRLKRFREITCCMPNEFTLKQWHALLDDMIIGITLYLKNGGWPLDTKTETRQMRRGMKLFKEWMCALWW